MTKHSFRAAVLVIAFGTEAWGQTPLGPNFQVNAYTRGQQLRPSIGVEPDGDFVVVWMSEFQDGDGHGVFGQRFDASGAARGGEFQVNVETPGHQYSPDVAVGGAGDFIVVWKHGTTIRGKRFDPAGDPVGGEFLVGSGYAPHVARASSGRFVVTWLPSTGGDVVARRFDSSGNPEGDEFIVNSSPVLYGNYWTDVAVNAQGDFVVAWDGECAGYGCQTSYEIFGQSFDALGNRLGPEFIVHWGWDRRASVDFTPVSNSFVLVWTASGDVRATSVSGNVNTHTAGFQFTTPGALAHDGAGNLIVTWTSGDQDRDSYGVFGQRFDATGSRLGAEFRINAYETGSQLDAVVGASSGGDFVVAWSGRNGSDVDGIVAQRFAPHGIADIEVAITDSPDPVPPGTALAYTVTMTNHGPDPALDVRVTMPTPGGLTFLSNTGACATPFPCALGLVPAGDTRSITATYKVPRRFAGTNAIVANVRVTAEAMDSNSVNNQATAETTFGPF